MGSKKLKTDKKLKNHIKYEGFKVGLPVPVEEMKRPLSFRNRVIMELSRKLNKLGVPPLSITREAYKLRVNAKRGFLMKTAASIATLKVLLSNQGPRSSEIEKDLQIYKHWDRGKPEEDITALHLAALLNHMPIVQLLINEGARINAQTVFGETPLHVVVRRGLAQMAAELVRCGADIHAQDGNGDTPLSLGLLDLLGKAISSSRRKRQKMLAKKASGTSSTSGKNGGKSNNDESGGKSDDEDSEKSDGDEEAEKQKSQKEKQAGEKVQTTALTKAQRIKLAKKNKKQIAKRKGKEEPKKLDLSKPGRVEVAEGEQKDVNEKLKEILSWRTEEDWKEYYEKYKIFASDVTYNIILFHTKVINYYLKHKVLLGSTHIKSLKLDRRNNYFYGVMEVQKHHNYKHQRVRRYEHVNKNWKEERKKRMLVEKSSTSGKKEGGKAGEEESDEVEEDSDHDNYSSDSDSGEHNAGEESDESGSEGEDSDEDSESEENEESEESEESQESDDDAKARSSEEEESSEESARGAKRKAGVDTKSGNIKKVKSYPVSSLLFYLIKNLSKYYVRKIRKIRETKN